MYHMTDTTAEPASMKELITVDARHFSAVRLAHKMSVMQV
jgi:hypothetical protein